MVAAPCLAACDGGGSGSPATTTPTERLGAQPLVARTQAQFQADLDGLRGRVVVVNFWASWCVPCYHEHPVLLRAAREHGAQVQFLGVVYDDEEGRVRDFLAQVGAAYPSLLDVNGRTAIAYGVYGVPETYFIDAQGAIVHKYTGPLDEATMEDGLNRIAPRAMTEAR